MPLPKKMVDELGRIVKSLPEKNKEFISAVFSQDALETIQKNKMAELPKTKSLKEICFHFFGMNDYWTFKRNVIGGLMVHSPEYPTYFIPAFTQAKATGDAKELKKGEGPRGVITGGLEGIAVGALVSGEFIKPKEMIPYIILGVALQTFSSMVFPWLGEKAGSYIYNKRMKTNAQYLSKTHEDDEANVFNTFTGEKPAKPKSVGPNPYKPYNMRQSGSMKI